jgi:hypothetical protein
VPLHADQVKPAQELRTAAAAGAAQREQPATIAIHPVHDTLARPGDVAVLQQRHQVVADRPAQGILEVDDTGIAHRHHHEVARMIVAVDEDLRLRQRFGDEEFLGLRQHLPLGGHQLQIQVPAEEPLRHQGELARQLAATVGGKLGSGRDAAHLNQRERLQRIAVELVRVRPGDQLLQVGRGAEVFQQQQAAGHVGVVHVGHVHAQGLKQSRHL